MGQRVQVSTQPKHSRVLAESGGGGGTVVGGAIPDQIRVRVEKKPKPSQPAYFFYLGGQSYMAMLTIQYLPPRPLMHDVQNNLMYDIHSGAMYSNMPPKLGMTIKLWQ